MPGAVPGSTWYSSTYPSDGLVCLLCQETMQENQPGSLSGLMAISWLWPGQTGFPRDPGTE
jgi:hypothetical protein